MSKATKPKRSVGAVKSEIVELEPDAWPRFEKFIKEVAKAGPQHRPAAKKTTKTKKK